MLNESLYNAISGIPQTEKRRVEVFVSPDRSAVIVLLGPVLENGAVEYISLFECSDEQWPFPSPTVPEIYFEEVLALHDNCFPNFPFDISPTRMKTWNIAQENWC